MPSLRALLEAVCEATTARGQRWSQEDLRMAEQHIRTLWPAERIYIPPVGSRKDPARKQELRRAAKKLPTGVAAERFGVTESWVYRTLKE